MWAEGQPRYGRGPRPLSNGQRGWTPVRGGSLRRHADAPTHKRLASGSAAGAARLIKESLSRPVSQGGLLADSRFHGYKAKPRALSARRDECPRWEADVSDAQIAGYRAALGQVGCENFLADGPAPRRPNVPPATVFPLAWSPGLGEADYPGFSVEECPERLPDLAENRTLVGRILRDADLYEKLRERRTSKFVPLARCVKPGMDNPSSPISGLVAGDADCYKVFRELFDPIVSAVHAAPQPAIELESPLRHPQPNDRIFRMPIDPQGTHALQVRVEASRNLEYFRFPTACDRAERVEVERLLVIALSHLSDPELKGRYFPLRGSCSHQLRPEGMSEEDERSLGERGFLFSAPEAKERLCTGVGRHWPEARGVFVADSGQLLAWCNEEDHLKLVSIQQDGNLRQAYGRFAYAIGHLDGQWKSGYKFAKSSRLGYLTSCPSNLGVRATVTLRLPLLSGRPGFPELCDRVQLRCQRLPGPPGTMEFLSPNQLAPDIANINSLILGCSRLVRLEQALEVDGGAGGLGAHSLLPGLGHAEYPGFPAHGCPDLPDLSASNTMVASVLKSEPELWESLRALRTRRGTTLAKCVKPGMDCPQFRIMGITAGDEESYTTFKPLIDKVMELRHAAYTTGTSRPCRVLHANVAGDVIDPWGAYAVSVRVKVSRNLSWFRFPPLCDVAERREVERLLVRSFACLEDFDCRGEYLPLPHSRTQTLRPDGMSDEEARDLRCASLLLKEPSAPHALSSGVGRAWPDARGVHASKSRHLVAWVNGEDHLLLSSTQPGGNLAKATAQLRDALANIEASLRAEQHRFAFHDEFGFLTSDPSNLGISASATLRLPRLSSEPGFKKLCQEKGLQVRPVLGGQDIPEGAWEVENRDKVGPPEPELVSKLIRGCAQLVRSERALARAAGELEDGDDRHDEDACTEAVVPADRQQRSVSTRVDATPRPFVMGHTPMQLALGSARPSSTSGAAALQVKPRVEIADTERAVLERFRQQMRGVAELPGMLAFMDGLGALDYPGFPTYDCPEALPDLSQNRSLMAQVLRSHTDMYERLRRRWTRSGVGLARCIKPGMDDPATCAVGAWAGDADCYEAFGELFDQLVELCHRPQEKTGCEAREDAATSMDEAKPMDPGGTRVLSVLVKSCRNLKKFRFPPACDQAERREVESILASALSHIEGDELHTTYYPLPGSTSHARWPDGMLPEHAKRLEEKRLLFAPPATVEQLSAGLGRDWPDARGVAVTASQQVVAWCNEQDHFQLVCTRPGAALFEAYKQHCEVMAAVEDVLQQDGQSFAHHPRLGYLTSNPAELGVEVIVTARLPLLSGRPGFFKTCQDHGLAPRAGGSRDGAGAWELANISRVAKSEEAVVARVAESCRRLLELEQALEKQFLPSSPWTSERPSSAASRWAALPGLGDDDFPGFPTEECPPDPPSLQRNRTLVATVLQRDPGMYSALSSSRTSKGVAFARCLKPGMDEPQLPTVGAVAGDAESYSTFSRLFNPLVDEIHGQPVPAAGPGGPPCAVSTAPIDPAGGHALSVRIRCSLNLSDFRFPSAINREDRQKVEHVLGAALLALKHEEVAGRYFSMELASACVGGAAELDAEAERELGNQRLLFTAPETVDLLASGFGRQRPHGRGVFASRSRLLAAWLNERDHIQMVSSDPGGDVASAFRRLTDTLEALKAILAEKGLSFASDERLGHLTSCPADLGLHASVVLRLPRLSAHPGPPLLETCRQLGLRATRLPGAAAAGGGDCAWEVTTLRKLEPPVEVVNTLIAGCVVLVKMEDASEAEGQRQVN